MLTVAARLLDRGVDILVVLAGTRIALWLQTYERLLAELDGTDVETSRSRKNERQVIPTPSAILDAQVRPNAATYMAREGSTFANSLAIRRPVIIVVPKVEEHLLAVSKFFEKHLVDEAALRDVELVVLDDEADDASVLDAESVKIIPRRIEMIWTGRPAGQTMASRLFATYVAYTATPQANFLQSDHNPLSPRDFCVALRAPYKSGEVVPRSVHFSEPVGIQRYYCGGELYYVELANGPAPLVSTRVYPTRDGLSDIEFGAAVRAEADAMLMDGLRAFLVSGAIRLWAGLDGGGLSYSQVAGGVPAADAKRMPAIHSMLVHPSAKMDLHKREAWRLVLLAAGHDPDASDAPAFDIAALRLAPGGIAQDLAVHEPAWAKWVANYRRSWLALDKLPGGAGLLEPKECKWHEYKDLILREVVPHVQFRIINSDPNSDDRPLFDAHSANDGRVLPPPDLLSIFVSGNVMSRGLTIQGLHSSIFTRGADEPAADTQMQMQRWFGYRGANAQFCRLFCFEDQLELLRTYHEHDTALRTEILDAMDKADMAPPITVLTGSRSWATAKVKTSRLPLHPGATPFVRLLETEDFAEGNARLLHDLRHNHGWLDLTVDGSKKGEIRAEPASLLEVADILDGLRYTHHDPDPTSGTEFTRWKSLERQLAISSPLFRPPGLHPGTPAVDVKHCPYSIAAYLRLWHEALLRKRCDGLFATHRDRHPWAMVQPSLRPPQFYIGVRFGSASDTSWDSAGMLMGVKAMKRGTVGDPDGVTRLTGSWGTRGGTGTYLSDQLFDYHYHRGTPPALFGGGPLWRPEGHPALLLFHVVRVEGAPVDAITVGLALPHGGPEQFAALPAGAPSP
ncbi:MAG: Z1 domain-containing protein [Myxococcota bacterium]